MNILAIDPGTTDGAYVVWDHDSKKIVDKNILANDKLLEFIRQQQFTKEVFIEKLMCYGMPVGAETFETAYWIGRALEICDQRGVKATLVTRLEVKVHHCHSAKAKDGNVRQALLDRLGPVGTKRQPGPLYGIATHLWSALAIALYANDQMSTRS